MKIYPAVSGVSILMAVPQSAKLRYKNNTSQVFFSWVRDKRHKQGEKSLNSKIPYREDLPRDAPPGGCGWVWIANLKSITRKIQSKSFELMEIASSHSYASLTMLLAMT